jgi:hypothetical protein
VPYEWVADSLGGGLLGLFGVVIVVLALTIYWDQRGQIKELKQTNKDLRDAINRLSDTVESWMPERQQRRLKRPT